MAGKFSLLTSLTLDATGFNSGIGKASKTTQEFGRTVEGVYSSIGKNLMAFAAGVGVVTGALEIFNKAVNSTDSTADDYAIVMAKAEGATSTFYRTLANGDWSNFLTNMDKAIKAGEEYAKALDYIENKQRGLDITTSEGEKRISEIRLKLIELRKQGADSGPEAEKLIAEALSIRATQMTESVALATTKFDTEMKNVLKRPGVDKTALLDFVKYTTSAQYNEEGVEAYKKLLAARKVNTVANASVYASQGGAAVAMQVEAEQTRQFTEDLEKLNAQYPDLQKFYKVFTNVSPDEIKKIADAMVGVNQATTNINNSNVKLTKEYVKNELLQEKSVKTQADKNEKLADTKGIWNELNVKLEEFTKLQQRATSTDDFVKYGLAIAAVKSQMDALTQSAAKVSGSGLLKPRGEGTAKSREWGATEMGLAASPATIAKQNKEAKDLNQTLEQQNNLWDALGVKIEDNQFLTETFSTAISGLTDAFSGLFSDAESGFKDVVTSMLQAFQTIINGLLATAIAGMIAHHAKQGILGLGLAAVGTAVLIGLWKSKVPKFEGGGIVGGQSFSGDKVSAMVNSGEMILNKSQQANLFELANGRGVSNSEGEIRLRVVGSDLVAVLSNTQRRALNFK